MVGEETCLVGIETGSAVKDDVGMARSGVGSAPLQLKHEASATITLKAHGSHRFLVLLPRRMTIAFPFPFPSILCPS